MANDTKALLRVSTMDTYSGDRETFFQDTQLWERGEKLETDVTLTDSSKEINFRFIDDIQLMVFAGDGDYEVKFVFDDISETVVFKISKYFVFSPSEGFLDGITSITITNTDITDVTVSVRVYGAKLLS